MLVISILLLLSSVSCLVSSVSTPTPTSVEEGTTLRLNPSGGSSSMTLVGYSWKRLSLVVPPHSAIDLVAVVENTDSLDTSVNCKEQAVVLFVGTAPPAVLPVTGSDDVTAASPQAFGVMFDRSTLCQSAPAYQTSIKKTNTTHWYLLIQTLGSTTGPDTSQCTITLHYQVALAADRTLELIFLAAVCLVFLVFSYFKLFRRINDQHRDPWATKRIVFFALPLLIKDAMTRLAACLASRCDSSNSSFKEFAEDPDASACRICREPGEKEKLISPCRCTGSLAFVHQSCLDQWRITARAQNPEFTTNCELCQAPFETEVSSKVQILVQIKVIGRLLLPFVILYLIAAVLAIIVRATLGEGECLAPYHHVEFPVWYDLGLPALGIMVYAFLVVCVDVGLQLTWDDYSSRPSRTAKVLSTLRYVAWLLSCPLAAGYFTKVIAYIVSSRTVWNWELCFGLGAAVLLVAAMLHVVCVLILFSRRDDGRRSLSADDTAMQSLSDNEMDSSPLHDNESISMASLGSTDSSHEGITAPEETV